MKTSLIRQLEHRYRVLERSLGAGLTDEWAWRVLGSRPPIGWHGAHLAEAIASTTEAVATGPGTVVLPPAIQTAAGRGGPPFLPVPLAVLAGTLKVLSSNLLEALNSLPEADFDRAPRIEIAPAFRDSLTSRTVFLEGHIFHVTYHLGAIALLRAEWGLIER